MCNGYSVCFSNERADYLSKIVDNDDWIVKDCYFRAVTSLWGPFSVDCFASSISRKVRRFYSKYFNPDSLGVDSLTSNWVGETCWLVPPVSLVKKVIRFFLSVQRNLSSPLLAISPGLAFFGIAWRGIQTFCS